MNGMKSIFLRLIIPIVVSIAGVYGLASIGLLPGKLGPTGPEGSQGPEGPRGPAGTFLVERYDWTLKPGELLAATVYLQEDDILKGSVVIDVTGYYFFIVNSDEEIVRWYSPSPNLEFSYVADTSDFYNLRLQNYGSVTAKVLLTYWVSR